MSVKQTRIPSYEGILVNMIASQQLDAAFVVQCILDEVCEDKTEDERDRLVQKIALANNLFGYWQDEDYSDCDSDSSVDVD